MRRGGTKYGSVIAAPPGALGTPPIGLPSPCSPPCFQWPSHMLERTKLHPSRLVLSSSPAWSPALHTLAPAMVSIRLYNWLQVITNEISLLWHQHACFNNKKGPGTSLYHHIPRLAEVRHAFQPRKHIPLLRPQKHPLFSRIRQPGVEQTLLLKLTQDIFHGICPQCAIFAWFLRGRTPLCALVYLKAFWLFCVV